MSKELMLPPTTEDFSVVQENGFWKKATTISKFEIVEKGVEQIMKMVISKMETTIHIGAFAKITQKINSDFDKIVKEIKIRGDK